jgi:TolA-binding protein
MTAVERYGGRAVTKVAICLAFLTALPLYRLTAQSSPSVRAAVQLAGEGRGDSARHLLDAQLSRSRTGDSTWIEALYWRARLAQGGEPAERDLRRIVVEYGNSPWADDALLQLSQIALTAGNPAAALDYATRLRGD